MVNEMNIISCKDLCVSFEGFNALKHINLEIEKNKSYIILGHSGSGKTTLLQALSGLNLSFNGTVTHYGIPTKGIGHKMSYVFQKDNLFPWKTVRENLLLGLINSKEPLTIKNLQISAALKELDVEKHFHKYPHQLSAGEIQRVSIARAVVSRPEILIMDEPSSSLDMITKESFQKHLLHLIHSHEMSLLMVTHDIEEALYLGQVIIVLSEGTIITKYENPLFGNPEARNSIEFYKNCIELRNLLGLKD